MARITVDDCLEKVSTRFELVHIAAKRVRQIREGSDYLVNSPKNEDIVVALREVAAGKVFLKEEGAETEETIEDVVETKSEDTAEEKAEETQEAKSDDVSEAKSEETPDAKTEDAVEAKAEDTKKEKTEKTPEDTTTEKK